MKKGKITKEDKQRIREFYGKRYRLEREIKDHEYEIDRLKEEKRGLKVIDLAAELGVTPAHISWIKREFL